MWRTEAYDAVIADRLSRKGDGFNALAELVSFIDRAAPAYGDAESRANVDLSRLRALSLATAAIPFGNAKREPYASWLAARKSDVTYDEPGGRWMVRNTSIWDAHAKHQETAVADDIAWFAVTSGLAGECETDLPCRVTWIDRLEGEYLRRRPTGAHVGLVHWRIADRLDRFLTSLQARPALIAEFKPPVHCTALRLHLDPLRAAVDSTTSPNQAAAQAALTRYAQLCAG